MVFTFIFIRTANKFTFYLIADIEGLIESKNQRNDYATMN